MIDFSLKRIVEKLGDDLVDVFSSPQYVPGCEIVDITDINEYATNNGWVVALCGIHNRQQVRYKGFPAGIQVGDFIDVQYFPNYKLFVCFGAGSPSGGITPDAGMQLLETQTVGAAGTSQIVFSDIIQDYTDLVIKVMARTSYSSTYFDSMSVRVNGDTANSYVVNQEIFGVFAGNSRYGTTSYYQCLLVDSTAAAAGGLAGGEITLRDYAGTRYKHMLSVSSVNGSGTTNNEVTSMFYSGGYQSGTVPIGTVTLFPVNGTAFLQDSVFRLYGVK